MIIPAGKFKAVCLKLMDQVQKTHEEVVITKSGRPVARLVPIEEPAPQPLFGWLKDGVVINGDIVAPTGEEWEVDG